MRGTDYGSVHRTPERSRRCQGGRSTGQRRTLGRMGSAYAISGRTAVSWQDHHALLAAPRVWAAGRRDRGRDPNARSMIGFQRKSGPRYGQDPNEFQRSPVRRPVAPRPRTSVLAWRDRANERRSRPRPGRMARREAPTGQNRRSQLQRVGRAQGCGVRPRRGSNQARRPRVTLRAAPMERSVDRCQNRSPGPGVPHPGPSSPRDRRPDAEDSRVALCHRAPPPRQTIPVDERRGSRSSKG